MNSRFDWDWYQATLTGISDPDRVVSLLLLDAPGLVLRESSGGFNHPRSLRGDYSGGSVAVYFGGAQDVHVLGSSGAAPHVAAVLRRDFPDHLVSRLDACLDFDQAGSFDRVMGLVYETARTPRRGGRGGVIGTETAGDWLDRENGRTLYAGGRGSAYRVRVYEKGHEQRSKHPDQTFSLDWTRLEAQIRPHGAGKRSAALATPQEAFAWSTFGAAVLLAVDGLELEPLAPARVPSTDPEYWLARSYSAVLSRWLLLSDGELRTAVLTTLARANA